MEKIEFVVDAGRVKALATTAMNRQYSGEEAKAFLVVHGAQMEQAIADCVREFIVRKLGVA